MTDAHTPVTDDLAERIARRMHPHLWDGEFEARLARASLWFTPEQAAASAAEKRAEKTAYVLQVLIAREAEYRPRAGS